MKNILIEVVKTIIIGAFLLLIVIWFNQNFPYNDVIYESVEEEVMSLTDAEIAEMKERSRLSLLVPYEGMEEKYIDDTIVGQADTSWTMDSNGNNKAVTKYYWYADNGRDAPLVVDCADGVVIEVHRYYTNMYWNDYGMPCFNKESPYKPSNKLQVQKIDKHERSSSDRYYYVRDDVYDVYNYDDPDDFADDWAEEFGDGNYDDGYDDAYEYWEYNY